MREGVHGSYLRLSPGTMDVAKGPLVTMPTTTSAVHNSDPYQSKLKRRAIDYPRPNNAWCASYPVRTSQTATWCLPWRLMCGQANFSCAEASACRVTAAQAEKTKSRCLQAPTAPVKVLCRWFPLGPLGRHNQCRLSLLSAAKVCLPHVLRHSTSPA